MIEVGDRLRIAAAAAAAATAGNVIVGIAAGTAAVIGIGVGIGMIGGAAPRDTTETRTGRVVAGAYMIWICGSVTAT
jgi:hypothetical protein